MNGSCWYPRLAPRGFLAALTLMAAILTILAVGSTARAGETSQTDIVDEIQCLALNIYFEARGKPDIGKEAVGHVVLNRVSDPKFPASICDVVRQGGEKRRLKCQFTWWCDGRSDEPIEEAAWKRSKALARRVFWGFSSDPTQGALWYHTTKVKPVWRKALERGPRIGSHLFYRTASDSAEEETLAREQVALAEQDEESEAKRQDPS